MFILNCTISVILDKVSKRVQKQFKIFHVRIELDLNVNFVKQKTFPIEKP